MTTKNRWERGPAFEFWMEGWAPEGLHDCYVFDSAEPPMTKERWSVLHLLGLLKVIELGVIYETVECIRIKVRDAKMG